MKTLIIGGGLSGLALADMLQRQGHDYLLAEARNRCGGRILTAQVDNAAFDMGPAWFWPGQPRIAALIQRLGCQKFDQYAQGDLVFEDTTGVAQRGRGFASMQGSWRLHGGLAAMTDALVRGLPKHRVQLNAAVKSLARSASGLTATLTNGAAIRADQVVLALPPRIAAGLTFAPALPDHAIRAMQAVPTWMAGQAKAVAVYDTPFWRDAGLSGDAQSRHGPMVEIHDASPAIGGPYALFGFIGVPPSGRQNEQALRQHLLAQLTRLFGAQAADPKALILQDWAFDPWTATDADHAPLSAHPTYGMPPALAGLWDGTLHFAGTEVAPDFGGYLEGALEAAEMVSNQL